MMSQIQLKYGFANPGRYQAAMATVREYFDSQGEKLVLSTITRVGKLFEVIAIWEVEHQGHHQRVMASAPLDDNKVQWALAELSAVVDYEQIHFLESLPLVDASSQSEPVPSL
jgi:hypothetical protein